MLNVDYKIACKAMADRTQGVIRSVIGEQQTGFIRGRRIQGNVMENIITCRNNIGDGAVVLLDFIKAYDRVNRGWLEEVLVGMNFGPEFRRRVRETMREARSVVEQERVSESFLIERGVRQGCPFAPVLFACIVEPMAEAIIRSKKIRGMTTLGVDHRISQFADDTCGYPRNEVDFIKWMNKVHKFEGHSGMKINLRKSAIIHLGKKWSLGKYEGMELKERDRLLGVDVSSSCASFTQPALTRYFEMAKEWEGKKWNIFLKAALVKACVLSKLCYIAPFLEIREKEKKELESAYEKAVWGKERGTKMRKEMTWNTREKGGLGSLDIRVWLDNFTAAW